MLFVPILFENTEGVFSVTDIEITNIDKTNPTLQVIKLNPNSVWESYLKNQPVFEVYIHPSSNHPNPE